MSATVNGAGAMSADELATASAEGMRAGDSALAFFGISVDAVKPGRAAVSMTVRAEMTNGHAICHGGVIFTLADTAFAYACNSYNQRAVAFHCAVTFMRPGKLGERLVAEAVERHREGRSGIYDVVVRNGEGEAIAEFRGHSRTIGGQYVADAKG